MLRNRLRQLAAVVDQEHPLAFTGHALLTTIGRAAPSLERENTLFRAKLTASWRALVVVGLQENDWREIGHQLATELEGEERYWSDSLDEFETMEDNVGKQEESHGFHYSREEARRILRNALSDGDVLVTPTLDRRADLFFSYIVRKVTSGRGQRAARNDWIDGKLLQHLAWPSFLMTTDFKMLRAIDETRSVQRAWVRTPVELAEERVARCQPWGKPARLVNDAFARQDLNDLRTRQQEWVDALRSS